MMKISLVLNRIGHSFKISYFIQTNCVYLQKQFEIVELIKKGLMALLAYFNTFFWKRSQNQN